MFANLQNAIRHWIVRAWFRHRSTTGGWPRVSGYSYFSEIGRPEWTLWLPDRDQTWHPTHDIEPLDTPCSETHVRKITCGKLCSAEVRMRSTPAKSRNWKMKNCTNVKITKISTEVYKMTPNNARAFLLRRNRATSVGESDSPRKIIVRNTSHGIRAEHLPCEKWQTDTPEYIFPLDPQFPLNPRPKENASHHIISGGYNQRCTRNHPWRTNVGTRVGPTTILAVQTACRENQRAGYYRIWS